MHTWSKNDAIKVNENICRVLAVDKNNVPSFMFKGHLTMADKPDSWEHVGVFKWNWNPLEQGWQYRPA